MLRISHYDLEVQFEFAPDSVPYSAPGSLRVNARLTVENTGAQPTQTLPLLFYRLHTVSNVAVGGRVTNAESHLTGLHGLERHHVNAVTVLLPELLAPGAQCTVTLDYGGVMAGGREIWQYLWDPVSRDYTLLRPDLIWYPAAATPDVTSLHDAYTHPKHFKATVHVPEGYTAVAPEPLEIQAGLARFRTTVPRERFDLAVAPFTKLERGGVAVYHLPGHQPWGESALAWVDAALTGLTRRLGPRPTGKLSIAQIPQGWGSQNSLNLILQEAGAPTDWHAAAQVLHEVSHFWTPAPADWPKRFADESLATFCQYILVADVYGDAIAQDQLTSLRQSVERTPGASNARLLDDHLPEGSENTVWYAKGALALHSLREHLGNEPFWALLREYTANATTSTLDFADLLTRRHPGTKTETYLHTWFR